MTTQHAIFTINGAEISAYRYLLSIWFRHAEAKKEGKLWGRGSTLERAQILKQIDSLMQATYTPTGGDQLAVTDMISDSLMTSLTLALSESDIASKIQDDSSDTELLAAVLTKITTLKLTSWRA